MGADPELVELLAAEEVQLLMPYLLLHKSQPLDADRHNEQNLVAYMLGKMTRENAPG